eukprot:CAMPEP_0170571206 /NCGR_PEP_ID=MMETSP0224-20130122/1540_1 /TAXON_ID=285029 /ORGANISM="Togula jolla, Strain CCCM 725" /LENGTH=703 /DNA_ID=CAMNT_0010893575 /DNA_START=30 /DNA_END=2139 /DNA_ORIENTATION=-
MTEVNAQGDSPPGAKAFADETCSGSSSISEFDPRDLMRHLQEQEGYAVYDLFERESQRRIPAPRRVWLESLEEVSTLEEKGCSQGGDGDRGSTPSSKDAASKPPANGSGTSLNEAPWVVLTATASSLPPPPLGRSQNPVKVWPPGAKGKAPQPPPSKAKAKGPPGRPPVSKPSGAGAPAKKAAAPPPFGKRLHWRTIPAESLEDTIFEELRPWNEVAPPLDTRQLERLFAPPPERAPAPSSVARRSFGKAPASAPGAPGSKDLRGQVCLLDAKRAQNLAIVLRQVPLPLDELSEVLRWMRVSHPITPDTLEHLYENLLPHLQESTELLEYAGPPEALRDVERQLLPLARLPRLKARLRTFLFSKVMPGQHSGLLERIRIWRSACSEVRDSKALRRVLGTVLRVGNFLNHGIDAPVAGGGEVRGFAVESLLRLRDFRAAQGESALHCVVLHLLPTDPRLVTQLRAELESCLGDVAIGALRDSIGRFQSEIDLVQGEIERFADEYRLDTAPSDAEGSGPLAVLQRLLEDANDMARSIQVELDDALVVAWKLLGYFGERRPEEPPPARSDEVSETVERFFNTVREFVASLEECWRDVLEQPRKLRLEGFPSATNHSGVGGDGPAPAPPSPPTAPREGAKPSLSSAAMPACRSPTPDEGALARSAALAREAALQRQLRDAAASIETPCAWTRPVSNAHAVHSVLRSD